MITMPTGTGKSLGFEFVANRGKTIYTVPIRALANEKLEEMPDDYPHLRILRDTGQDLEARKDFDYVNQDVIITTNERLLSIMNNAVQEQVFENVEYIVFDEIHMIDDISRGATLEWIIMRLKRFHPHIMIIGLSATLPNYKPFADWLGADYTWIPDSERPIPLKFYYGSYDKQMPVPKNLFKMEQKREFKFGQLVSYMYKFKEQFLVFLSSKRDIEKYARQYAGLGDNATLDEMMKIKNRNGNPAGVAFHHADIEEHHKKEVLDEFKAGNIRVIFCSPTLAVGVNLPATNCVIFDMSFWNDIGWYHEPLPSNKLAQMFGRAGRVGYSDIGRVIILGTEEEIEVAKWHIANPTDTFSQFGRVIVDKILNMIVSKIAINLPDMYALIKESFLFYQQSKFDVGIIEEALKLLLKYRFITTDDDYNYRAIKRGFLVTKMYIKVHTIIDALHKIYETESIDDMFDLYRIFLSNEDFLGSISCEDTPKDKAMVVKSSRYFRKSRLINKDVWINVYDKDENLHVSKEKRNALLKVLALMFKDDIIGKNVKVYTSHSTIWKLRRDGSGLIARLSTIFEDELNNKGASTIMLKQAETSLKFGIMNEQALEMFMMEGVGAVAIERLMKAGIDSKKKFLATSQAKLKALGIRNAKAILLTYKGELPQVQTAMDDFF